MEKGPNRLLLLLPLTLSLFSCAKKGTITIRLEEGKSNSYAYGESYHSLSLAIYENGEFVRYVVTGDLASFTTKTLAFDTPLTGEVTYEGTAYPFTYQVSSVYEQDSSHYTLKLSSDSSLEVTAIGNPSKTQTDYVLPDTISTLSAPLNSWPVKRWSASFGGLSALKKVTLNPSLTSFTGLISTSIEVDAASSGNFVYDAGGFLSIDKILWGIAATCSGDMTLPEGDTGFVANAFAAVRSGITSLTFPTTYSDYSLFGLAQNLPDCAAFNLASKSQGYYSTDGFLYCQKDAEVQCLGIPMAKKVVDSTLVFPEGLTRFRLDGLNHYSNPAYQILSFPASLVSFAVQDTVDCPSLTTLIFHSPSVVKTTSLALDNLPASIQTIKVASSLLESYQKDNYWSRYADRFVAF